MDATSIWLPPAHTFRGAAQVRKAVTEYDSNLDFGFNENTQQWCIFLRHGSMAGSSEGDLPILGFRSIPTPDQALQRLWTTDARRRGRQILDAADRDNARIRKEQDDKHAEVDAEVAEVFEWGLRHQGKAPNTKVFLNGTEKD